MNVLVASTQWPYISGGAEALAAGLVDALRQHGHRAETLLLPFFPSPVENVLQSMQVARTIEIGETNFGPIDRLITLKFPAYLIDHPAKTLWLAHQYRQFYDLWDDPNVGFESLPHAEALRAAVHRVDRQHLPGHRRLFAISNTVAQRLRQWCDLDAETLYPPLPDASGYYCDEPGGYFVCPGRLSVLKRQELVLRSLALTRAPVRITFIGGLDDSAALDRFNELIATLNLTDRVEYLGWISDADKRAVYARSIGVVCVPRLEDLGLITQEAMLSAKPVITCLDSGGVLEFVSDGENGMVVAPEPAALAGALDDLWAERSRAARLGQEGLERVRAMDLSWPRVVQSLLS